MAPESRAAVLAAVMLEAALVVGRRAQDRSARSTVKKAGAIRRGVVEAAGLRSLRRAGRVFLGWLFAFCGREAVYIMDFSHARGAVPCVWSENGFIVGYYVRGKQ